MLGYDTAEETAIAIGALALSQCATDNGKDVNCGVTVTDCGGFVSTLVTELTQ